MNVASIDQVSPTEDEVWDNAIAEVRSNWTTGFLEASNHTHAHCAVGALGYARFGQRFVLGADPRWDYTAITDDPLTGPMLAKVAQVIQEQYPEQAERIRGPGDWLTIVDLITDFNDNEEADGHARMVAVMEKARNL